MAFCANCCFRIRNTVFEHKSFKMARELQPGDFIRIGIMRARIDTIDLASSEEKKRAKEEENMKYLSKTGTLTLVDMGPLHCKFQFYHNVSKADGGVMLIRFTSDTGDWHTIPKDKVQTARLKPELKAGNLSNLPGDNENDSEDNVSLISEDEYVISTEPSF